MTLTMPAVGTVTEYYTGAVTYLDTRTNLNQVYPVLDSLVLPFERTFESVDFTSFCYENMWIPVVVSVVYAVTIFGIQSTMKERDPYDLKGLLGMWNALLSTFSVLGFVHTMPHLLHHLYVHGLYPSLCGQADLNYGQGAVGFWSMLFVFSKFPELIDTLFITLRKKRLMFLHWYHHITVLCYCWHSYGTQSSAGIWFIAMNYGVHGIMYWYYYRMAVGRKPSFPPPIFITLGQLSQMVVGIFCCAMVHHYKSNGQVCHVTSENAIAGGLMYFSYFLLFLQFFVERFVFPPAKKTDADKKKA